MYINLRVSTLLLGLVLSGNFAYAAEPAATPHQIIEDLGKRMYVIGETTGELANFVEAEEKAALLIRENVSSGADVKRLVERNEAGQTPLMVAASLGYSDVVRELLVAESVRQGIDDKNPKGVSAWLYANIALAQTRWACEPAVFENPFSFVPLFVTQPYYLESAENPYRQTRKLLEAAGAKADLANARAYWLNNCKNQADSTRSNVMASSDLLETLLKEGADTLEKFMATLKGR